MRWLWRQITDMIVVVVVVVVILVLWTSGNIDDILPKEMKHSITTEEVMTQLNTVFSNKSYCAEGTIRCSVTVENSGNKLIFYVHYPELSDKDINKMDQYLLLQIIPTVSYTLGKNDLPSNIKTSVKDTKNFHILTVEVN